MRFPTAREREYLRDLVFILTQKEIKLRYKNSWLGYVWSIANPLAFALVYFISFKTFMRIDIPNYTLFLIVGLFPWQWLSNSIGVAPTILLGNASLIKKVRFPRAVLRGRWGTGLCDTALRGRYVMRGSSSRDRINL